MKNGIHPTYFPEAKITCACGNVITVGSTVPEMAVELCANCHPFFTGKQKLVDTARRVEKFRERVSKKETAAKTRVGRRVKHAALAVKKKAKGTKAQKEK